MSKKHPIISVTGSSGAGTSTVKHTFEQIFRRENVKAISIEGDAFHKFDRYQMREEIKKRAEADKCKPNAAALHTYVIELRGIRNAIDVPK